MFAKVMILGRLPREPENRQTQSAMVISNFAVAVNRKNKNGEDETSFIDCVAFGKTAQNIGKYFAKGDLIFIDGNLQQEKWQDKNGENRSKIKVVVNAFDFAGGKGDASASAGAETKAEAQQLQKRRYADEEEDYGDIPF